MLIVLIKSIVLIIFIEFSIGLIYFNALVISLVDGDIFVSVFPLLVCQNGRGCCESEISTVCWCFGLKFHSFEWELCSDLV